jgi:hypothetical protein
MYMSKTKEHNGLSFISFSVVVCEKTNKEIKLDVVIHPVMILFGACLLKNNSNTEMSIEKAYADTLINTFISIEEKLQIVKVIQK